MQVREYTRACVRAFVRSCVRSCVRALVRSLSQFISPIARTQWALASYYLWLWIGAVYKFGGTLTDYKYRLSRSEYIISSFIISNLELEHRATTAATNKFPLWWRRWRWWFRTTAKVINSLANFASSPSRIPIVYSSLHGVNLRPRARTSSNQSSILYTSNTFELPKKGVEKGVKGNSRNSFLGRRKEESKFFHCLFCENIERERESQSR